jgi:type IV pilus assembly protein PilB
MENLYYNKFIKINKEGMSEGMQGLERKKTEDILIEAGLLSSEKLKEMKEVEQITGERLEKILLSEDVINYKEILTTRAGKMGVDFVDLENICVDKNAISIIKSQIAVNYGVLPFDIKNNLLYLAMQNPDDIFLIDEIKVFAQMEIKPFLSDSRLLGKAVRYFYNDGNAKSGDSQDNRLDTGYAQKDEKAILCDLESNKSIIEEQISNGDELLANIILKATKLGCSDIHIDLVDYKPRIRYRLDGVLIEEGIRHDVGFEEIISKIKVFTGLNTCDSTIPQKGYIKFDLNKKEKVNLEILILPVSGGEKLLIKLKNSGSDLAIENIGMSEKEQKQVGEMLDKCSGMIIITGLSGSGKTTTSYTFIKRLISRQLNIVTLEKKLSEKLEGVSQLEIENNPYKTVSEYMGCIIDHDPDVVMTDIDIKYSIDADREVLRKLMDIALSGKLVIVTTNFPSAYEAISGLLNMGFENYMVASAVSGIIVQHLVRKRCTCLYKDSSSLPNKTLDASHNENREACNLCSDTGYKGRTGVFEVFTMNKECKNLIIKDRNIEALENSIRNEYSSFRNNCIRLINDNVTTVEEFVRIGVEKDMLNF